MATQVIFDTNAYRKLTYGKNVDETISIIDEIRRREALKDIVAFASPIVWTELFCHLADPEDKALHNCYCALIGSYFHCLQDVDIHGYRIIADGGDLLASLLFNYVDPANENLYHGFAQLIYEIYHNANWKSDQKYINYLKTIKTASDKEEMNFLNRFKEIAADYANRKEGREKMLPILKSDELFHAIAETQVFKALINAKRKPHELDYAELSKNIEFVKNYFPAALHLSIYIMDKLIDAPGFDITKKKRHNWVWDYQLLFYISNLNSNILITDDKAMLDAAKAAGLENKVMKISAYKLFLGL